MTTQTLHIDEQKIISNWKLQKKQHEDEVDRLLDSYLDARSHQQKDPVMDFLFEYYHFRPAQLKKWTPGVGRYLTFDKKSDLPDLKELNSESYYAFIDISQLTDKRIRSAKWILDVLIKSSEKKPSFGCFGMHEWAMVYKTELPRHQQVPLRMEADELAQFVESRPLLCTHFDAFRFFTKEAQPLNKHELSREVFEDMEQPGCIHSNMDLYKWAFKMYPFIPSSLILDAFKIASEARFIDMKASPYDLIEYGLEPIRIETEEGRVEYKAAQEDIYRKAAPIRERLIEAYELLLSLA